MTGLSDRTALRWGGATDVGRVRTSNQDQFLARQDKGIWAVADGMGGHNGGEIASQIACQMLGDAFAEPTVEGLVDAVEAANAAVHRAGADDPQLTGMGTTVVALAVVEHEGDEVLAIANVGDSRCYRYAAGELDQVTTDHSLVADLVREGSLSPEEAAVHPQRNIVTRVLGVHDEVPVDVFAVDPHDGDRFVLCSDGLFNEVPEPAIAAVLATTEDPEDAAHELVRLAVDGGGRDNVTVVVVDVVGDGGRAAEASTALAREGGPTAEGRPEPRPSPAYATEADPRGRLARRRTDTAELERVVTDDGDDLDDDEDRPPRHRKRRRITWRVVLFTVLLLAVVGGAVATIHWYGTSAYFVGFDDDRVAIFRGRPGGVLWVDPELVERSDLTRDRVPRSRVADSEAGIEQGSLSDARRYVANVSEQAEELEQRRATTTTTAPPATAPPTTAPTPTTAPPG